MKRIVPLMLIGLLCSCAGFSRMCSSTCAGAMGADWVIVQMDGFGRVMRCWELHDVSVANEGESDGIYWRSGDGHLVHISGHYNRVQVAHRSWDNAFSELGITREACAQVRKGSVAVHPEIKVRVEAKE